MSKIILFCVNVDWFFKSHRLPIALECIRRGYEVHVAAAMTIHEEDFLELGIIVHRISIDRGRFNIYSELNTFISFYRIMKKIKPNIVHLVTIKPVLFGGIAARLLNVESVVAAISGLGFVFAAKGFIASFRKFLVTLLYRAALGSRKLKVIFQNSNDRDNLIKLTGLDESKTTLIHGSGVDLHRYVVHPLSSNQKIVILAARLLYDKGVKEFVDASGILRKEYACRSSKVRFILVGEPDTANPRSVSHDQLKSWVEEGVVEHWGHRNDMPEVLSAASIVTLPSFYGEGLPKVLIEAAACGRAVVTTDHPGCRDAIEPGVSGVLVPVRDAQALADAIQDLLDHPEKCVAMGLAGRDLAERAFDVNQVVAAHLKIYEELMAKAVQ